MRHIAVILVAVVMVAAVCAFVACGANAAADEEKEVRIVASDHIDIRVQEHTYDGWRISEEVSMVEYLNNGALVRITYEDGTVVVSAATNYLVKVRTK